MATLVKFRKFDRMFDDTNEQDLVFAYFPQLNYNKRLYGTDLKMSYAHLGQHAPCSKEYGKATPATKDEYLPLLNELRAIGYDNLKICK